MDAALFLDPVVSCAYDGAAFTLQFRSGQARTWPRVHYQRWSLARWDFLTQMESTMPTALADRTDVETDDIDDVPVPAGVLDMPFSPAPEAASAEAPAHLDLSTLEHKLMMMADAALMRISREAVTRLASIEAGWLTATQALLTPPSPQVTLTPYACTVQAVSGKGFPMAFTIQALTQEAFVAQLQGLIMFLGQVGFAPPHS